MRSPNYPAISLREAVEAIKKLWDKENRSPVAFNVAAGHLGYKPTSSGAALSVAALKKYGFVAADGGGSRLIRLTDAAVEVLKHYGNEEELIPLLKEAALRPEILRELFEQKRHSSPESILNYLEFDRKFTKTAAQLVLNIFLDTISFAKFTESDKVQDIQNEKADPKSTKSEIPERLDKNLAERVKPPPPAPMTPNIRYLPIPLDIGDAPIPVGMSDGDFDLLLDTLKLWKKKIVRPEQPNPAKALTFPRNAIWKNKDHDVPVVITDIAGDKDGVRYYQSSTGTGIPASELKFE